MIRRICFALLACAFVVFFQNCKKEPDRVGAELIPESGKLQVGYTDTLTIFAHSRLTDSVRTDETSYNLLGSLTDPVFGRNTASFYTQLRLSGENPDFGPNPQVDSVILTLDFFTYYGDTSMAQTIHVYEMSKSINIDSSYYSNYEIPDYGFDYANFTYFPKPQTPVFIGDDTIASSPRLMINLSKYSTELGDKILNADSASLSDNENFVEYFYGLHLVAQPVVTNGAIIYFDLESSISNLAIYYKNDTVDSLSYVLNINEKCARYGHFDHNGYQEADVDFKAQVLEKDTLLGNEVLYLQSMAGVETQILLPYVDEWFETDKIVVNTAQLVLPAQTYESVYDKAPRLLLYRFTEEGLLSVLGDELEGAEYFGGYYDSINNEYKFRITRYIQNLMLKTYNNYGLSLSIAGIYNNAYRVLLNGTDPGIATDNRKVRLELTYTVVD